MWKAAKDVLLAVVTLFVFCLVWGMGRATKLFWVVSGLTVLYAVLHLAVWAAHPDIYKPSAILGLTYNLRLPCFVILGYGATLLWPDISRRTTVIKVVLAISGVVALLGVLQYFLPKDILTHFGYSVARGVKPNFFIDDNSAFPRVMSTLRDPNSLGAYLIVPLTLTSLLLLEAKKRAKRLLLAGSLAILLLAEWLTYSRSALAASLLAIALVTWWHYRAWVAQTLHRFWPLVIALVLLMGVAGYSQRHNQSISGVVTHTTNKQTGQYDSNQLHIIFVKRGLHGIAQNPWGHGPGTAGLASIQNPKGSFLTENYYVQVGYEVGVLGLLVFVTLNLVVWTQLWRQRNNTLASVLLATGVAYVVMNMLLHTWSNEAVACQWWLLAGMSLAAATGKRGVSDKPAHQK